MIKSLLRHYRPKIQFRVGQKKLPQVVEEPEPEVVSSYEKPSYLSFKTLLSAEEIDVLNQGGQAPAVHWKKVAPLRDIYLS